MTFKPQKITSSNTWMKDGDELNEQMKSVTFIYGKQDVGTTTFGLSAIDLLKEDELMAVILTDPVSNFREIVKKTYMKDAEKLLMLVDENGLKTSSSSTITDAWISHIYKNPKVKIILIDAIDTLINVYLKTCKLKSPDLSVPLLHHQAGEIVTDHFKTMVDKGYMLVILNKAKNPFITTTTKTGGTAFKVDKKNIEMMKNKDLFKRWATYIIELPERGLASVKKTKTITPLNFKFAPKLSASGVRSGDWLKQFLTQKIK